VGDAVDLVGLVIVAAGAAGIATRLGLSSPLVLTAVGLVLSFLPGVPLFTLEPEIALSGILPPLLYATAIRTPWVDIKTNRREITLLSVGLVLATALAVAGVVMLLLPKADFALALALGAVVAPPDAVAASAVARRVGMPRRVVTLLEGESLLNDATALVTLRTAIAAIGGSVHFLEAGGDFLLAIVAGAGVGWLLAMVVSVVRTQIDDPVLDTTLSLVVPFVAYLAAERIHGSGVLAVVVAGLILGARSTTIQSAASRVTERILWRTVQFLLESIVFLIIGLQLRKLLADAAASDTTNGTVAVVCVAVLVTVIVVRMAWVFPAAYLPRLIPAVRRNDPPTAPNEVALVGWAGMRGVVTLAAALTIPKTAVYEPTLMLAAFTVVAGTLLLQGPTLPWLVRVLRAAGPDPAQDALTQAQVQLRAAKAGLTRLQEEATPEDPPDVLESLHGWGKRVSNAAWERLGSTERETPAQAFRRLRVAMLAAERKVVVEVRESGSVPHEIVERVLERLDQEEAMLAGFSEDPVERREESLVVAHAEPCEHLQNAPEAVAPQSEPDACPDCLAMNERSWVHLRMCLACGHVGCCDSSPNRHATAHYHATDHPVIRSIELGESWRWCYPDAVLG
jgi:CPA1 family monovalent cation:H+ antiporter